jgi:drug/metabolite transporter (DMT)-like permease
MPRRAPLVYASLTVLWALSFVAIKGVVGAFGWALAVSLTCVLVGATVGVVAVVRGHHFDLRLRWSRMFVMGLGLAVHLTGLTIAVDRLGIALGAAAVATVPLFSTVIGQMWGVERITLSAAVGLVVGFVGSVLLLLFPSGGISWSFIAGMFAGLLSGVAGAMSARYAVVRMSRTGSAELVSVSLLIAGVLTAPLALAFPGPATVGPLEWAGLLLLAVVLGGIGYSLDAKLREREGIRFASSARSGATIAAVLIGVLILGETLSAGQVVGVLLLILGCVLVIGLVPAAVAARRR